MRTRERDFDKAKVTAELDTYVKTYAERMAFLGVMSAFPPNLDSVYEYMTMYGAKDWQPPAPDLRNLERYQAVRNMPEPTPGVVQREEERTRTSDPASQDSRSTAIANDARQMTERGSKMNTVQNSLEVTKRQLERNERAKKQKSASGAAPRQ
jgi:hypothetical protein